MSKPSPWGPPWHPNRFKKSSYSARWRKSHHPAKIFWSVWQQRPNRWPSHSSKVGIINIITKCQWRTISSSQCSRVHLWTVWSKASEAAQQKWRCCSSVKETGNCRLCCRLKRRGIRISAQPTSHHPDLSSANLPQRLQWCSKITIQGIEWCKVLPEAAMPLVLPAKDHLSTQTVVRLWLWRIVRLWLWRIVRLWLWRIVRLWLWRMSVRLWLWRMLFSETRGTIARCASTWSPSKSECSRHSSSGNSRIGPKKRTTRLTILSKKDG